MKRKLARLTVALALIASSLVGASGVSQAAVETNAVVWFDANYSGTSWNLQWTSNECSSQQSYNWYYGLGPDLQYFPLNVAYAMSSEANYSHYCNRVWLTSGGRYGSGYQGWLYSTCQAYGQGISWFGFPYNDNIQQIGLSRDPSCG